MARIMKFIMLDIVRNKIVLGYTLLLAILSWSAFLLQDNNTKGILTLLSIVLLTVPLVSIVFSTIYLYNSAEFIEVLVSQPVHRRVIWISLFSGLCLAMLFAFMVGAGVPVLIYAPADTGGMIVLAGCLVSMVFVALSCLGTVITRDKAKGIGIAILLWLFLAVLYDGLVLFVLFQLSDYPIEKAMVVTTALNPIDLARILIILKLDVSAMFGYTGAIFRDYFGATRGKGVAFAVLAIWVAIPFWISIKKFGRKDL